MWLKTCITFKYLIIILIIENKIVNGLERLSDIFKSLLWEKAKVFGISPIQIQIMLFVANHKTDLCNITYLSKEFNLTKPTISDAVKSLHSKGYLEKDYSSSDSRSYSIFLTSGGKKLIEDISNYALPIRDVLSSNLQPEDSETLYILISELIYKLYQTGVIQVQRMCFGCRFYSKKDENHFCGLLNKSFENSEIRLDCSEFEEKSR